MFADQYSCAICFMMIMPKRGWERAAFDITPVEHSSIDHFYLLFILPTDVVKYSFLFARSGSIARSENEITTMKKKRKKHIMTVTLHTSSKILTTWYYHEHRRFHLSYCRLCFRAMCKYSFRYTWNFPNIWLYEYLFDDWLARSENIHAVDDNSCRSSLK